MFFSPNVEMLLSLKLCQCFAGELWEECLKKEEAFILAQPLCISLVYPARFLVSLFHHFLHSYKETQDVIKDDLYLY